MERALALIDSLDGKPVYNPEWVGPHVCASREPRGGR